MVFVKREIEPCDITAFCPSMVILTMLSQDEHFLTDSDGKKQSSIIAYRLQAV